MVIAQETKTNTEAPAATKSQRQKAKKKWKEDRIIERDNKKAVKEAFENFKDEIACIIIEPVPANNGLLLQGKDFLDFLREICSANNTLLIFDEVISGV